MDAFQAGTAVREFTPPPGAPLWGYTDREGPATGTLDPLYARASVFAAGGRMAALVVLDLGRPPVASVCHGIRERVRKAGVETVVFIATHTHHAPVMEDAGQPWVETIAADIGDAIEAAAAALSPAQLAVVRTRIDIAHNRRAIRGGKCHMRWRNDERIPTEPIDQEATIIRIDDTNGTPLATLVHYACHPVIMGPSNLEYSADYVGELCRLVEEHTGAPCLFLQGACGDINPYLDKTPMDDGAVQAMRHEGRVCADAVIAAWRDAEPAVPLAPAVAWCETPVPVGCRWNFEDAEQRRIFSAFYGDMWASYYLPFATPEFAPSGTAAPSGALLASAPPKKWCCKPNSTSPTSWATWANRPGPKISNCPNWLANDLVAPRRHPAVLSGSAIGQRSQQRVE